MEGAPSTPTDLRIDIKQEPSHTASQEHPKVAHASKHNLPFEASKKYKRSVIHDQYGGQRMSGISTPAKFPYVFLFTAIRPTQASLLYCDGWQDDGTFIYTGSGQEGDMQWKSTNVAVRDHKQQRKKLLLFTNTTEIGFVEFVAEMECKSYHNAVRLDRDRKPRGVFEFVLKPVNSDVVSDTFKMQFTVAKEHDTYCATAAKKVIKLEGSSTWMKDEKAGIVMRKRTASDIENCEENMATKRHKTEDNTFRPKDVAVCTNSNYIVDMSTVRKRGRPKKIRPEEEAKKDGLSVVVSSLGVFPGPRRKFSEIIKELSGNGSKVCLDLYDTPMPEKEGKEVPVNNELMLDRIDFAVDDNEASLPSEMDIPQVHDSTRQQVFDSLSPLDDNPPQDDFDLLLASPDLFDMSDDHLNKSKDPEIDPDLMASFNDNLSHHVHNTVLNGAALTSVNISAESHLSTEQIKSFLDLPEVEDVMAEFEAIRRKSTMYKYITDDSMELLTQQSSIYDSSQIKSGRPSAVCHLWSSSPQLLTQESYILSPVSSVYN
eukprot:TRINITY_DN5728_c0_g1_i1.p1 TRINITY_DN5728_c0_g1~~TRINITY_DN5728_c0_g1_i1.p1  ORF type:complete len:543 (-),score=74.37 TRINITY_DN5728_c0_g1_i1:8-1636(-)